MRVTRIDIKTTEIDVRDGEKCLYFTKLNTGLSYSYPMGKFSEKKNFEQIRYPIELWLIPGVGQKFVAFEDDSFLKILMNNERHKFSLYVAAQRQDAVERYEARIKSLPWWRRLFNQF